MRRNNESKCLSVGSQPACQHTLPGKGFLANCYVVPYFMRTVNTLNLGKKRKDPACFELEMFVWQKAAVLRSGVRVRVPVLPVQYRPTVEIGNCIPSK